MGQTDGMDICRDSGDTICPSIENGSGMGGRGVGIKTCILHVF